MGLRSPAILKTLGERLDSDRMTDRLVSGVERAVFGQATEEDVARWLDRHVRRRLSLDVSSIVFRSGRVSAVYGLKLSDGSDVVVKAHRNPVDVNRLAAASACQLVLADAGYPCPIPIDGPATTEDLTAFIERRLDQGELADAHDPDIRRALAGSLAEHIEILRPVLRMPDVVQPLVAGAPAWAAYEGGPWPPPHDPIFDFSATPAHYQWLDDLAQQAADVLGTPGSPDVIGHSDWVCQNVRFTADKVTAAYDWDSLIAHSEPVVAGLAAGAHTEGSSAGAVASTPEEVTAFLADYDDFRGRLFSREDQTIAAAAATWVLAYNARCGVTSEAWGFEPAAGSPLRMLSNHRDSYMRVNW